MIKYQTQEDGSLFGGGWSSIPVGHSRYSDVLNQVKNGEAEILPYIEPKQTQEQFALGILREEGITQNTVTLALYLNATQSDPTLLNRVDTTVKSAVSKSGASYEAVTAALTGV